MTNDRTGTEAPGGAPVERQVGRLVPKRAVCVHCGKPDAEWTDAELKQGRRIGKGYIEYHCYTGYVMD